MKLETIRFRVVVAMCIRSANEVSAKLMNPLFKAAPFLWRPLLTSPLPFNLSSACAFPPRRRLGGVACISHSPLASSSSSASVEVDSRSPLSSISLTTVSLPPPLSAEYPWQVAILKKEEFDNVYLCGGSLIDGSHIVTAAHCVDDFKPNELRWVRIPRNLSWKLCPSL